MCYVQKFIQVNVLPHRGVRVWHMIFLLTTAGIILWSVVILCKSTLGLVSSAAVERAAENSSADYDILKELKGQQNDYFNS